MMKKSNSYLFGIALMLASSAGQADVKRNNACAYAHANQRCITVPLANTDQDAAAKKFLPHAAGKSSIYIVRSTASVKQQASTISLNGHPIADLGPFTYVLAYVSPGHHKIRASADKSAEIELDVRPGKLYFIHTGLSLLFFTVSNNLVLLDEAEGKSRVLKAARVADLNRRE
jgi:hypothetical protein